MKTQHIFDELQSELAGYTKAEQYCKNCNAPSKPPTDVLMRCGLCAVVNGKLPPTKYQPIEAAHGIKENT